MSAFDTAAAAAAGRVGAGVWAEAAVEPPGAMADNINGNTPGSPPMSPRSYDRSRSRSLGAATSANPSISEFAAAGGLFTLTQFRSSST